RLAPRRRAVAELSVVVEAPAQDLVAGERARVRVPDAEAARRCRRVGLRPVVWATGRVTRRTGIGHATAAEEKSDPTETRKPVAPVSLRRAPGAETAPTGVCSIRAASRDVARSTRVAACRRGEGSSEHHTDAARHQPRTIPLGPRTSPALTYCAMARRSGNDSFRRDQKPTPIS